MKEWQPIETAPIEETVLVWCPIWGRYLARQEYILDTPCTHWVAFTGEKGILPPKYWSPILKPPEEVPEIATRIDFL